MHTDAHIERAAVGNDDNVQEQENDDTSLRKQADYESDNKVAHIRTISFFDKSANKVATHSLSQ